MRCLLAYFSEPNNLFFFTFEMVVFLMLNVLLFVNGLLFG